MNMVPLVNDPCVNRFSLREQNLSLRYIQSKVCFKKVSDLSKEVLCWSLYVKGLPSYKLSNFEVSKKNSPSRTTIHAPAYGRPGFDTRCGVILKVCRTATLQSFDLQRLTVPIEKVLDS